MPIENNLPTIFDTATETEDGLMSYQDKIKLNRLDGSLDDKISKTDKIASSQLDTSSDSAKIQPENLSDAVKQMMTGQSSVEATVPNNGVTTEKIATNAITIDKIDKRVLLGNIVSPRPLNFAFDTKKVSITIPQNTLLLTDATTKRNLVTNSDTQDITINLNYPTDFDGLNYIVSEVSGSLSMINYRKVSTISNTSTIIALVSLTSTFNATVVMNGNYTINGLAQGIGTESAALLGTGKIVFDKLTGIIDFTEATTLHLIIGGMFNRTISSQPSIRLSDYSEDSMYILYWDNPTSSLKTSLATITNSDTDINKIAMIKDGLIIPFVNTGIYYSKPYIEAPYYTETFDMIDTIGIISKTPINIVTDKECKLEFFSETYVYINQDQIQVQNQDCYYEDREGLHFILFDLDDKTISCRHYKQTKDDNKNIVIGTMWISDEYPQVTGNIEFTVDGKTPYQNDLSNAEESINTINDVISSKLANNKILAGDKLYMINGQEMPIYTSSMLLKDREGIKCAISYSPDSLSTKTKFFNENILLDSSKLPGTVKLLASAKYEEFGYLLKEMNVVSSASNRKSGQTVKIMCLGDNLLADKTVYYVKTKLSSLNVTPKMLGTMVNDQVYAEGRNGWFYSTFIGASGRGQQEGKITPQTSKGTSSILLNPFLRTANADDKANNPNDCYRSTGAYIEKNYYNDTDKNGAFYIFDFAKYLEVQGIETPDVIIIAVKPELVNLYTEDIVSTNVLYLKQLVAGIRKALPDTNIILIPQYAISTSYPDVWENTCQIIEEVRDYVSQSNDSKLILLSSWLHMSREFGTEYDVDLSNSQLYSKAIKDSLNNTLTESAKIELADSIVACIMSI